MQLMPSVCPQQTLLTRESLVRIQEECKYSQDSGVQLHWERWGGLLVNFGLDSVDQIGLRTETKFRKIDGRLQQAAPTHFAISGKILSPQMCV